MKFRSTGFPAFAVIVSLAVLSQLSCSGGNAGKGADSASVEPLSFSWFVAYDWFSPPNAWGADPISGWLKENKGVDVKWIAPSGASAEKLNLMIVTGELPDVVCLERGPSVTKLIDAGMILPLDPYLDKMPNLKKWAGEENLALLRHTDGKLYQFPNWYISPDADSGNGSAGWAVNSRIYADLGSPKLVTFDDLEAYLKLVKAKYPNIIPLEACDNFQAAELIVRGMDENLSNYMPNVLGTPERNSFTKVFKDWRVRETFVFISRLFRQKLITQDAFTQTRDQVIQKLSNGQVAVVATWDVGAIVKKANDNNKIDKDLYQVIWPPVRKGVDPKKVTLSGYATLGWNVNVVTKKAAPKAEALFAYLDWLTGEEGQRVLCYGPPGHFWDETDDEGVPLWNERYANASTAERDAARMFNWNWVGNTTWVDLGKVAANKRLPPEKRDKMVEWQGDVLWRTVRQENEFAYDRPAPDSEIGIIETQLRDLYDEARALAVFAVSDAEVLRILDEMQSAMDDVGYAQYLAYHNDQWRKRVALIERIREK